MVDLSRLMRKTALDLYTQPCNLSQKLQRAKALDDALQEWVSQLPRHLWQTDRSDETATLKPQRTASYVKKQSVVLRLREFQNSS